MTVLDTQFPKLKKYTFFRNAYIGNKNKKSKVWLKQNVETLVTSERKRELLRQGSPTPGPQTGTGPSPRVLGTRPHSRR